MKYTCQPITLETRLPRDTAAPVREALTAYADRFSRAGRAYFARVSRGEKIAKPEFMTEFGLTGRQFNAVKVTVEGMIDSQRSNLPNYALQCEAKADGLARRINQKRQLAGRARAPRAAKLWGSIKKMQNRLQSLRARAAVFRQRIADDDIRICFGSRRRFNAQHHLEQNDYDSHSDWAADWRAARASQFFVLGSKDEAGGCQGCSLIREDDETYTLRLRMPAELVEEHGRYAWLTGIRFPYRPEVIESARLNNRLRTEKQAEYRAAKRAGATTQSEGQYLADAGQALSYRFVQDEKGWRVLVTTNMVSEPAVADTAGGVIGVDFNANHLAVASLDAAGAKVALDRIELADHQATSRQNKTQLQEAAKAVIGRAAAAGKPVVIEKLSFRGKKAGLQKQESGRAGYHRMLSRLSHRAFAEALKMQALRSQVAIIEVNPAYTSLIGRLKYGRETGFDTHQAAAWVIGRRGMGKRDGLPSRCAVRPATRTRTFVAPEDARKDDPRDLKRVTRAFSQWCSTEWAAWRRCQKNWQWSQVPAGPDVPF